MNKLKRFVYSIISRICISLSIRFPKIIQIYVLNKMIEYIFEEGSDCCGICNAYACVVFGMNYSIGDYGTKGISIPLLKRENAVEHFGASKYEDFWWPHCNYIIRIEFLKWCIKQLENE